MAQEGFARRALATRLAFLAGLTFLAGSVVAGYRSAAAAAAAVSDARRTEQVLDQARQLERLLAAHAVTPPARRELTQRLARIEDLTSEVSRQKERSDTLRALTARFLRRPTPAGKAAIQATADGLSAECERQLEQHGVRQAERLRRSLRWQLGTAAVSGILLMLAVCSLFDEVRRRTRAEEELSLRQAELQRSNQDLERFAAVASHDLKAPLGKVILYLDLLKRRAKLDESGAHCLAGASGAASGMVGLIDDLLSYSRAAYEPERRRPEALDRVLDEALANLEAEIAAASATISREPLPTAPVDAAQMRRVFQNLIGNALKFRRADVPVVVRVSAERAPEEWIISVADNGIGVPLERAGELFQLFRRLHGASEYPGHGLGLAIAKRVVERHGGRIWIEPTPGGGTTFRFTLPAP